MAEHTAISWCDSTFNPWIGCTRVSPGCDHCYAARSTPARTLGIAWGAGQERHRTSVANWKQPLRWNRLSEQWVRNGGQRTRVFCSSLADVFDNAVPRQWLADLLQLIDLTPHLDWLLLTKRIGNVVPMLKDIRRAAGGALAYDLWPRPNIWIGATVVDQAEADRDIHKLLGVPAAVRFLSIEPMLGPIVIDPRLITPIEGGSQHGQRFIDWVICGGESGPQARPMHPDWPRSLRDQCTAAGVPFFFKQWGGNRPDKGGDLLDGVRHQAMPM